jgi:hypothetical protein
MKGEPLLQIFLFLLGFLCFIDCMSLTAWLGESALPNTLNLLISARYPQRGQDLVLLSVLASMNSPHRGQFTTT